MNPFIPGAPMPDVDTTKYIKPEKELESDLPPLHLAGGNAEVS